MKPEGAGTRDGNRPLHDKTEYRMKDSQRSADAADEWTERQLAADARLGLTAGEVASLRSVGAVLDLLAECDKDAS